MLAHDQTVTTVDRIAAILRVLSAGGAAGVSLTDIAEQTNLSKTTVHRLLSALVGVGYAYQQLPARHYRLGAGAITLGGSALRFNTAAVVQPVLDRLADATGDTVFASIREGAAAICVARAVGGFPIRTLTLDIGDRRPLGVGSGSLALLAALSDAEIDASIGQNIAWLQDFQGFSPDQIRALVAHTRADGYAFNDGQIVSGMNAVAVAVCDRAGVPQVALSIAAIRDRMTAPRRAELVQMLMQAAASLAHSIDPLPRAAIA